MRTELITQPVCIFNQIDKDGEYKENPILITFYGDHITLQHPDSDNHITINVEFIKSLFTTIHTQLTKVSEHREIVEEHYKRKYERPNEKVVANKNSAKQ